MDIVKQVIDLRVNKVIEENPAFFADFALDGEKQKSFAFLLLGVAAYLDIDVAEAAQYLTDGGNDGGFDAAYIAQANEGVIEGITLATNSQNPVDFRDMKSNDEAQRLLEQGAKDLGYVYKRKKDNKTNTEPIPSTVAAEAVFAIWRKKPHLAKYKKGEFFNAYYNEIFDNLNAAQMIIAVLIFRMCDGYRKKDSFDEDAQAQRSYSHYLIAAIVGVNLLKHFSIDIREITHLNFVEIKNYFDANRDDLYHNAEQHLLQHLKRYFREESLENLDGRSMAAAFRRFDFVENVLKD